jgi:hypothetical protein
VSLHLRIRTAWAVASFARALERAKVAVLSPGVGASAPEWGPFRTLNWTLNAESRPQRERRAAGRRAPNPAISRQNRRVARAGIEPGTPRFSIVIRPEKAAHDRRRADKKCLQIAPDLRTSVPPDLRCGRSTRASRLLRGRRPLVDHATSCGSQPVRPRPNALAVQTRPRMSMGGPGGSIWALSPIVGSGTCDDDGRHEPPKSSPRLRI